MAMCFAAGLNVAVTRTPFASPLILAALAGQPNITAPALCAALASLFVTRSSKFIGPQSDRADLQYIGDLQPLKKPAGEEASELSVKAPSMNGGAGAEHNDDSEEDSPMTASYRQGELIKMMVGTTFVHCLLVIAALISEPDVVGAYDFVVDCGRAR